MLQSSGLSVTSKNSKNCHPMLHTKAGKLSHARELPDVQVNTTSCLISDANINTVLLYCSEHTPHHATTCGGNKLQWSVHSQFYKLLK